MPYNLKPEFSGPAILDIDYLSKLKTCMEEKRIPKPYTFLATKNFWLILRKNGFCDFTDQEMEAALSGNKIIRVGTVTGLGEVHMMVDRRV
jgi:hypothetical protein